MVRRRAFLMVLLAASLTAAAFPALAAGKVLPPSADESKIVDGTLLSDEKRITRWAHIFSPATVRSRPSSTAKAVGRLRHHTEDRLPEIYLLLRAALDSKDRVWVQVRLPKRPNGSKGWVPRSALGDFKVVRTQLVVNRKALRATLFKNGKRIWSSPVGIGKSSAPTPAGHFWIRERIRNLAGGAYGPWAFGTAAYSNLSDWPGGGVVGIHGTNEPHLIPGRPSHGCIRVPNHKVVQLERRLPLGTPLHIK
jgi:hypothetical protein